MAAPYTHPGAHPRMRVNRQRNDGLLALIKTLLEVIVLTTFAVTFIVQPFRIPSESMEPTLEVGDFLLVDKQSFGPAGPLDGVLPPATVHRGDLVVFHFPPDPARTLVKRVIGLPGERLRLREGEVYINEVPDREPYAVHSRGVTDVYRDNFPSLRTADPNADPAWWAEMRRSIQNGEITVPPQQYFVMGDNRDNSEDSRYWGFVPRSALIGRPLCVYFTTNMPDGLVTMTPGDRLRSTLGQMRVLR